MSDPTLPQCHDGLKWAILALIALCVPATAEELKIIHINIGQGDSTLILATDSFGNPCGVCEGSGGPFIFSVQK